MSRTFVELIGIALLTILMSVGLKNSMSIMTMDKYNKDELFITEDKTEKKSDVNEVKDRKYMIRPYTDMQQLFLSLKLDSFAINIGIMDDPYPDKNINDNPEIRDFEKFTEDQIKTIKVIPLATTDSHGNIIENPEIKKDKKNYLDGVYNDIFKNKINKVVRKSTDVIYVFDKDKDPRAPYLLYIINDPLPEGEIYE